MLLLAVNFVSEFTGKFMIIVRHNYIGLELIFSVALGEGGKLCGS